MHYRLAALVGALLVPPMISTGQARAFNSHETFALSPLEAGGGGRYFTGSFSDGFNCSVCHRLGEEPEVEDPDLELQGLDREGYVPGETYEWFINLPNTNGQGASIEVTDGVGNGQGTLSVFPVDQLQADDLCDPVGDDPPEIAAHAIDAPQSRTIVAVDSCGAERVRVLWQAPADNLGPAWINAAVVAANGDGDPGGDGVWTMTTVLPLRGDGAESARVGSFTCSVAAVGPPPVSAAFVLLLLPLALLSLRAAIKR